MSFSGRKTYRLGEIATFYNGRAYKNEEFLMAGTPIVRIQNLTGEGKTVYTDLNLEPNKYIDKGDLIYAWSATFGPYLWKGDKSIYHYHIWKIECKENLLDKHYFYYTLKHISDRLKSGGNGTLFVHITKGFMESFEIDVPYISIQRKTASILSGLDDAIELNQQINKTLEEMAKAIFKEWFVDFNFPNTTGKFQETEIGKIPVGWEVGKLGDVCEVNKNTLNKKTDLLDWIDYIEISEVSKGLIGKVTRYNLGEEPSRAKRKLKHGDTVLSTVRPDRGSYFLAIEPKKTDIASTGFAVFSPLKVPFSYLHMFLTDDVSFKYYGQVANGGAYPAINPITIMEMDLIIPDAETLSDFHKIVEPFFIQIQQNIEENQSLTNLRDTLLPKLMKGEIEIREKETV